MMQPYANPLEIHNFSLSWVLPFLGEKFLSSRDLKFPTIPWSFPIDLLGINLVVLEYFVQNFVKIGEDLAKIRV